MISHLDPKDKFLQDRQAVLVTYPDPFCVNEAKELAESAEYIILSTVTQRYLSKAKYGISEGKAEKLRDIIEEVGANIVIFDEKLRSTQIYNLAKLTGCEIIDRERMILEIFSKRATTTEAKLQIELAELVYEKPRAKEKVRLARISEQPGFFGLGKYEIDVYDQHLKRRISKIKMKLRDTRKMRELHRIHRERLQMPIISLAGYTGAGKTTLFNKLTGDEKEVGKMPFTTLTTSTRLVNLNGFKILLSDTVGFISKLPNYMIEAFKSTLEELIYTNQLLLILDVSQSIEDISRHYNSCVDVLIDLGVSPEKVFLVFNKSDMQDEAHLKSKLLFSGLTPQNSVFISAKTGLGINVLLEKIKKNTFKSARANVLIKKHEIISLSSLIDWLKSQGKVEIKKQNNGDLMLNLMTKSWVLERFTKSVKEIRKKEDVI